MSLNGYPFQVHDCACNPPHNAFYSRRSQSWIIYICKLICVEGCWKQKCILKYLNSFLKVIFRVKLPGSVIACLRASMKFILFILKRLPWMFNGSKFSSGSSLSQSSFEIFKNIYFYPDYGIKVNFVLRKYILKFTDYITSWSDAFSMFENNPRQHLQNQHLALFVEVFFFVRCKTRCLPEGYYFNSLQSHVLANLTNRYAGLERHVFFLGVWWVWMVNMLK